MYCAPVGPAAPSRPDGRSRLPGCLVTSLVGLELLALDVGGEPLPSGSRNPASPRAALDAKHPPLLPGPLSSLPAATPSAAEAEQRARQVLGTHWSQREAGRRSSLSEHGAGSHDGTQKLPPASERGAEARSRPALLRSVPEGGRIAGRAGREPRRREERGEGGEDAVCEEPASWGQSAAPRTRRRHSPRVLHVDALVGGAGGRRLGEGGRAEDALRPGVHGGLEEPGEQDAWSAGDALRPQAGPSERLRPFGEETPHPWERPPPWGSGARAGSFHAGSRAGGRGPGTVPVPSWSWHSREREPKK